MKKRAAMLFMGLAFVALIFASMPAFSQEGIVNLADSAFGDRQRPPAVFEHDQHNEKANMDDCSVCHHVYQNGEKVEDESSEDSSCSGCHNVTGGYPTRPLMNAYHDLCTGCHVDAKAGPVTCGECHPRKQKIVRS